MHHIQKLNVDSSELAWNLSQVLCPVVHSRKLATSEPGGTLLSDEDFLKRLRAKISAMPSEKVEKANRTLFLNRSQFDVFKSYCETKGIKPSEVVDKLIAIYLEEVEQDLS